MKIVWIAAFGVGGATIAGGIIGLLMKRIPEVFNDAIMGFSAGVMLAAALFGLMVPALESTPRVNVWGCGLGILAGAVFLKLADIFTPILHSFAGVNEHNCLEDGTCSVDLEQLNKVLVFVSAIAIHNFPEGLAAGVGFGTEDVGNGISIALGIALQNIPEGMVVIAPLLRAGVTKRRVLFFSLFTGSTEIIGTLIGYLAVSFFTPLLPFALGFAGGTILHVIVDEMVPEIHGHGHDTLASYSLIGGFIVMMVLGVYI
jgi:ZIP family zinc transporter